MVLPPDQVARFYSIWIPLLVYVNEKKGLLPDFDPQVTGGLSADDAMVVRDALWAEDSLLLRFAAENPDQLNEADLRLVVSWQRRVSGTFFVFKYLKKYSVFIAEGSPSRVYGVLGLASQFEEIIGSYLPIYTKAVLLPFEGKITFDSLLMSYPQLYFGSGIRGNLNHDYRSAQERGAIITNLEPQAGQTAGGDTQKELAARNKKILTGFQKDLAAGGLSMKMIEQHSGAVEAFAHDYLLVQQPPRGLLDLTADDLETYLNSPGLKASPVSFKRFVRFLYNSDRLTAEQEDALVDYAKGLRG